MNQEKTKKLSEIALADATTQQLVEELRKRPGVQYDYSCARHNAPPVTVLTIRRF